MSAKINNISSPELEILEALSRERNDMSWPEMERLPQAEVDAALKQIGIQHLFEGHLVNEVATDAAHSDAGSAKDAPDSTQIDEAAQDDREFLKSVGIDSDKLVDWIEEVLDGDWEAPSTETPSHATESHQELIAPTSKSGRSAYLQKLSPLCRSAAMLLVKFAAVILCVCAVYDYRDQSNFDTISKQINLLHAENKMEMEKTYKEIVSLMQTKDGEKIASTLFDQVKRDQDKVMEIVLFGSKDEQKKLASWQVILPKSFHKERQVVSGAAGDTSERGLTMGDAVADLKLPQVLTIKKSIQPADCENYATVRCVSSASINSGRAANRLTTTD